MLAVVVMKRSKLDDEIWPSLAELPYKFKPKLEDPPEVVLLFIGACCCLLVVMSVGRASWVCCCDLCFD